MNDKPKYDDQHIRGILNQSIISETFLVAYDIGLFEYLDHHKKFVDEICSHHGIAKRPMEALLSVCINLKLIKVIDGFYSLSDYAKEYLLKSSPFYFGEILNLVISNRKARSFDSIKQAILTNKSQVYHGQKLFQTNEAQESLSHSFTKAMHTKSMGAALAWPEQVDLSHYTTFLDIGGGAGTHTISVCSEWKNLKGIIFDRPFVCQLVNSSSRFNLSSRVCTSTGDMWQDAFPQADVHFYSDILHDWNIDKCKLLLNKSYFSLPVDGKIIIHEMLYNKDKVSPTNVVGYNLTMLLWAEGQQFSPQELTQLLLEAGFIDITYKPALTHQASLILLFKIIGLILRNQFGKRDYLAKINV